MIRSRILHLIKTLEAVPEESYNQAHWWCGTTGCAAGHAAQDPHFQELGLKADFHGGPIYRDQQDFEALAAFFDISLEQAHLVFGSASYEDEATAILKDQGEDPNLYPTLDQLIAAAIRPHHVIAYLKELLK